MNILYILSDTTMFGGGTKSFLTLFEGLCNKGIEPTIVLPDNN